ncbi:DUF4407 domain-containing protein [Phocaeicola sp. Sa1CVN1]|uniref:DUF4407 domain-containing protein n=1 Tax=Phocaeicola intestinalis TaxID=2762212 RepID=A0ABR8Y982_9BACT|nr:DUF4407 domain-containing protein [Phocaeicola intestinalis]MBD8040761.1 DUF4407 domain-containing protein [Phocaeicola intestinalis]
MTTRFERILWAIAGAERHILEKCRTDHKKFSAIGATILMTSIIAFVAGSSAAWYFTKNGVDASGDFLGAVIFGIIWSLLIFCIDRSLVITLKKNPTAIAYNFKEKITLFIKLYFTPLFTRSLLAGIIAFMVSVPLELFIFEDYILSNKEDFEANEQRILGERLKENSGEELFNDRIKSADVTLNRLGQEKDQLKSEVEQFEAKIDKLKREKQTPNSKEYIAAQNKYNIARKKYNELQLNYRAENKKKEPSISLLSSYERQIKIAMNDMQNAQKQLNTAKLAWENRIQKEIDSNQLVLNEKKSAKEKTEESYNNTLQSQLNDKNHVQELVDERRTREETKGNALSNGNQFITNFQILEYSVWQRDKNGNLTDITQLLFLWLVRTLFFIIEILPTIVKIVSPIGSYERMVYAEEQAIKEYVNSGEFKDSIFRIQQLKQNERENAIKCQTEAELNIRNEIAKQIELAQVDVSKTYIDRWKQKELKKIESMHNENSGNLNEV